MQSSKQRRNASMGVHLRMAWAWMQRWQYNWKNKVISYMTSFILPIWDCLSYYSKYHCIGNSPSSALCDVGSSQIRALGWNKVCKFVSALTQCRDVRAWQPTTWQRVGQDWWWLWRTVCLIASFKWFVTAPRASTLYQLEQHWELSIVFLHCTGKPSSHGSSFFMCAGKEVL